MKFMSGDEISYQVYYLEMETPPSFVWPNKPPGNISILGLAKPSSQDFLDLYREVGDDYEWTDKYECAVSEIDDFLLHPSAIFR